MEQNPYRKNKVTSEGRPHLTLPGLGSGAVEVVEEVAHFALGNSAALVADLQENGVEAK
jgi:hypothetical protein